MTSTTPCECSYLPSHSFVFIGKGMGKIGRKKHTRSKYWGGITYEGVVDESDEISLLGGEKPHLESEDGRGVGVLICGDFVIDKVKVKHLSVVLKGRRGRIILRPLSR